MAATAYAAAVSLLNTMDQIQIHSFLSTYFNINYSIESLRENVDFFVDFLEKYSDAERREAEDLLRRIADVAHEAEEVINVEAAHRIRDGSTRKRFRMTQKLKKITREMDCIKEKATMNAKVETGVINPYSQLHLASSSASPPTMVRRMAAVAFKAMPSMLQRKKNVMDSNKEKVIKAEEKTGFVNQHLTSSSAEAEAALPAHVKTNTMVGFDGYMEQLLDQLTGHHSGRQILPIVGMGGIGKTTLATNVYQNSHMLHHFDIRAWITVSQEFTVRNIILQALSCLVGGYTSNISTSKSESQLGEDLFKNLYGRRYLIVLDDIWSVEAWEKMMFFFPDNNNGSRIVVTTRESELVDYFGSSAVVVDFLGEKNSWELFCEKAFVQEGCPHELEEIGKKIVEKCKGLPLAITVFGGLLRKSPRTREYWEIIANDKSLILESGDGNIKPLSILYLSYKYLPVWLKPCFLYLGLFPEDRVIDVFELIKLWVAEGFIRSKTEQSLEEIAESYTRELVDRNLLLAGELGINKKLKSCKEKLKSCKVHDVVRELCIWIGAKEKYFCVQRDTDGMCHFIVDEATERLCTSLRLCSPHRFGRTSLFNPLSILEAVPFKSRLLRAWFKSRLLRVMFPSTPSSSQPVNLRFFYHSGPGRPLVFHSSIQLFWSLQTLIVDCFDIPSDDAPPEIWKMTQLRHIEIFETIFLPDPPSEDDVIVLHSLQTLKRVKNLKLSEEVCKRIPNIKELEICNYELYNYIGEASTCNYHLHNLGCFNKLESLELRSLYSLNYPGGASLPSSLKYLTLRGCRLMWRDMTMIAALPHLEFLKLHHNAVVGPKWDCVEVEFLCLKHLFIYCCDDLINWNADSSNFPVLETLSLWGLSKLVEIPSDIGEIPTLERIDVEDCSESSTMSAIKILEEQESFGNQSLQLTLKVNNEDEVVMWRGKIEQLDFTCQNLHIIRWR